MASFGGIRHTQSMGSAVMASEAARATCGMPALVMTGFMASVDAEMVPPRTPIT